MFLKYFVDFITFLFSHELSSSEHLITNKYLLHLKVFMALFTIFLLTKVTEIESLIF